MSSLDDADPPRRPHTSSTAEIVEQFEIATRENRHVTTDEVVLELGVTRVQDRMPLSEVQEEEEVY